MENRENFGKEAAETLENDFYADNLFNSVVNENVATQSIKTVGPMCLEGGFNLTKFICNNKIWDLLGGFLEEQTQVVLWKIENDTLGFKVSMKNKTNCKKRNTIHLKFSLLVI